MSAALTRVPHRNPCACEAIRQSPTWREQGDRRPSTLGIRPVVGRTVLAALPERGSLNCTPMAAWVGVAPLNRDSGTLRGKRRVWSGLIPVRADLICGHLVQSGDSEF